MNRLLICIMLCAGVFVCCGKKNNDRSRVTELLTGDSNISGETFIKARAHKDDLYADRAGFCDTLFTDNDCPFSTPGSAITVLNNGHIVLCNESVPALYLFDAGGNYIRPVSKKGRGPGEYVQIDGVDCDDDCIYVAEGAERKIMRYDYSGRYLDQTVNTRKDGPKSFKISPVSQVYYYYHVFPNHTQDDSPVITMGRIGEGIVRQFGTMNRINKAACCAGGITGIAVNEKGYLFCARPEEYGYVICSPEGDQIAEVNQNKPAFFRPVHDYAMVKKVMANPYQSYMLYYNHSRLERVFYLGDNILALVYVSAKHKDSTKSLEISDLNSDNRNIEYEINIELRRAEGEYVCTAEINERIDVVCGKNGCLYYWMMRDSPDKEQSGLDCCMVRWHILDQIRAL